MSIKIDTKGLDEFANKLKKASSQTQQEVVFKALDKLSADVLSRAVKQTPRDTSNLARSWKASPVTAKRGNTYKRNVYNSADYGVYVEYGHRTRNHRGWVPGKFMLTRAIEDVDKTKDQIVSEIVIKYFGDLFND